MGFKESFNSARGVYAEKFRMCRRVNSLSDWEIADYIKVENNLVENTKGFFGITGHVLGGLTAELTTYVWSREQINDFERKIASNSEPKYWAVPSDNNSYIESGEKTKPNPCMAFRTMPHMRVKDD